MPATLSALCAAWDLVALSSLNRRADKFQPLPADRKMQQQRQMGGRKQKAMGN